MSGNERYEVRKGYRGPVDIVAGLWDQSVTYLCEDLSPGGTFLKTSFPLSIGETVVCSFRLPGTSRDFDLFGKVTRVEMPRRKGDRGRTGMGVSFRGASAMERLLIRSALRRVAPPVPEQLTLRAA